MNKLWGEIKAYLKWVSENGAKRKTIPTNRERIDERERERERESLPIDEGG